MDVVYLDNNATTKPDPQVVEAMLPYLTDHYGNPSSLHRFGQRSRQGIDEARERIADFIGCSVSEFVFTGGGTEAVNTVVRGLWAARQPKRRIITSTVEHSATKELCNQLEREGASVVRVGVDRKGELNLDELAVALAEGDVALVTMMWANNETGVLFPAQQVAEMCKASGVPYHCDGTQAIGKIPANMKELGVDAMSFAAHKFHGPKGVGGMYIRRGLRLRPLLMGGPQEQSRRGGTENVAGIVGMGKAAELAAKHLASPGGVEALRDRFEQTILRTIEDSHVNGSTENRLPNTSNIGFARLEADAILLLLSEQGICASAGAACSSGSLEASPVLRAMKIDDRIAHGAVRFSLSRFTTDAEVDRALAAIPVTIGRLREVLPVG